MLTDTIEWSWLQTKQFGLSIELMVEFNISIVISDQTLINRIAEIGDHCLQIHTEAFKAWTAMKPAQCWVAENDDSVFTLEKPEVRTGIMKSLQEFINIYKQLTEDFKTFL